ncbi:PREDICTED: zinc finger protein 567-like isoform X2 [Papilio polytes]|uniref:zinc finger protein 567-like isoform X2 n=1 Tax=Papilio polytes TaxID=76194 RepID=UPI0006768B35|nr:PREDICTED: zinc finger protein 567-like isoform X2 [Papilio polytes]
MSEIWKLEQQLCRCCHAEGAFENLSKPRELNGITEIYSNMLKACFQIVIDSVPGPLNDMTYAICESCVLRLRDAYEFMRQVQNAEIKFKDYYNRNAIKGIHEDCDNDGARKTEENDCFSDHEECTLDDDFFMHFNNEDLQNSATKEKGKTKGTKIRKVKKSREVKKVINKLKKAKKKVDNEKDASEDQDGGSAPKFRLQSEDYKKDGDAYLCGHCNKRYKLTSLRKHVKSKHYKIPDYNCRLCNSQFMTIAQYTVHKLEVHNIDDRHKCKACNSVFNTRVQLNKHKKAFHMLGEKRKCDLCDYESFSIESLYKHKYKHKTVKDHHCSFCRKSFVRKTNLNLHERIHTGDRRNICKECGQAFVQKASLNYHMMKYHPSVNF